VPFAGAGAAAAGLAAVVEVLGLNISPRLNLPGDGEGVECAAAIASFLALRLAFGEPAGETAGEGDAATPAGEASARAFLAARCFAGEGDSAGVGDCACEIQMPANATTAMRAEIFVIISARVRRRMDHSQSKFEGTQSGRCAPLLCPKLSP
jgi:hypothetical protein